MGKKGSNASQVTSDSKLAKKPAAKAAPQSFFNPKPASVASVAKEKPLVKKEQSTQTELPEPWTRTEFLLSQIVDELKNQNELRFAEFNQREAEKQIALEEEQAKQKEDQERFEEHKSSLFM